MTASMGGQKLAWYGWKRDKPDQRDEPFILWNLNADVAQPKEGYVGMEYMPRVRSQGAQGACTGFSVHSHGEVLRALEGQPPAELSPRFGYWNGRAIEGTTDQDAGCEIRDVIKGVARWGFGLEEDCPYDPRDWRTRPSQDAYTSASGDIAIEYHRVPQTLTALRACVLQNNGFVFGFSVYSNFESTVPGSVMHTGIMPMPQGYVVGGHAVFGNGYSDEREAFLIQNSWGEQWGCAHPQDPDQRRRGMFWMPYQVITSAYLCADFWTVTKVS